MRLDDFEGGNGGFLKAKACAGKEIPVILVGLEVLDLAKIDNPSEREEKFAASFQGKEARVMLNNAMREVLCEIDPTLARDYDVGSPVDVEPMALILYTRKFTMDNEQKDMFCFRNANAAAEDFPF